MIIGYARVSTYQQDLQIQIEALEKAGCEKIYQEKITGKDNERPALKEMLSKLKRGDTLIIYKLDRLARNLIGTLQLLKELQEKDIEISIVTQPGLDTRTTMGRAMFQMVGVLAEMERSLILERTHAGRQRAIQNGLKLGRKKGEVLKRTQDRLEIIKAMLDSGYSQIQIASKLKLTRSAVCMLVKKLPLLKTLNIQ